MKSIDTATLGNLCVDIVLRVPRLPPPVSNREERRAYVEQLVSSPQDKKFWEAGGNCNVAIAAARLGLRVFSLGRVGNEIYGRFLLNVLQDEGIRMVKMNESSESADHSASCETHLCWVLLDPFQNHDFCSRDESSEEPALSWMTRLPKPVTMAIQQSKILICDGYAFNELSPDLIIRTIHSAVDAGAAVFFDPGPQGRYLVLHGTPEQKGVLELLLRLSDVLLLTSDEAESLTGIRNPILAGKELIRKSDRTKWIIIKMGSKGSILITQSSISCAPAFNVNVADTVGCGDSYTAAIAFGYSHDMPEINTLALANAVGAATAMGTGAGRNVATLVNVLEILRQSNLLEDDDFWNELFEEKVEAPESLLLSGKPTNGHVDGFVRVPIQTVVSHLLPMFEENVLTELSYNIM